MSSSRRVVQPVLIDAGPLIALVDRSDPHHKAVVATAKRIVEPRVTVWPAFTEAMYMVGAVPGAREGLWTMITSEVVRIAPLDASDAPRMRELMAKYSDRPMDLADAALVRVAERDGLRRIFTVDRADFSVYRIGGREKFELVG